MAVTRLSDMIVPEVFAAYVTAQTMEKSALVQGGIVANDAVMNELAGGPSTLINMPYLEALGGESEVMSDAGQMAADKLVASQDVARKLARTKAWGATGLSAALTGADPMGAVADSLAEWWARDLQRVLLSELVGVFAAESMAGKVLDISGKTGNAALWSAEAFVDANQLMGDAKDAITAVAMHSAVEAYLAKQQLIEYETGAEKGVRVPMYMGKRVIVDDGMPYDPATGKGAAYLFGEGAFALGNGKHPRIVEVEVERDRMASSGEDYLVSRRVFLLHPRGVKWTEADVAGLFPTNAELAKGENWKRVFEEKAVRMVKFAFALRA